MRKRINHESILSGMSGTVVEKKEIRLHGRKVVYRASQPAANRGGIVVLLHGYSFNSAIWDGSGVFSALNSVGLGGLWRLTTRASENLRKSRSSR
ncbi:hypothetical protein [Thermogymnomonas acidicola]|uniref:hypothetical protein n=1 Tax=Thermogymnomonas acidicola TaxID=399579 RepID=UPI0014942950|nr:hypothetical protein [Thermogymnomonas acidicola]